MIALKSTLHIVTLEPNLVLRQIPKIEAFGEIAIRLESSDLIM